MGMGGQVPSTTSFGLNFFNLFPEFKYIKSGYPASLEKSEGLPTLSPHSTRPQETWHSCLCARACGPPPPGVLHLYMTCLVPVSALCAGTDFASARAERVKGGGTGHLENKIMKSINRLWCSDLSYRGRLGKQRAPPVGAPSSCMGSCRRQGCLLLSAVELNGILKTMQYERF